MRLIDADAFLERMSHTDRFFGVVFDINDTPTVDAVPVVRCGDCKHSRELDRSDRYEDSFVDGCLWCMVGRGDGVLPDQFCDYGERENKFVK